jgi:aconitate hydratase 2/2-methylisocitrate dehydratase
MTLYSEYLQEIAQRKEEGLNPKPIDSADLLSEIISLVKDSAAMDREQALKFFVYNVLPGTTSAAGVKAAFLKEIILGQVSVAEISAASAFEQLSHMKGGPSIEVLLDLALGDDAGIAAEAAKVISPPTCCPQVPKLTPAPTASCTASA